MEAIDKGLSIERINKGFNLSKLQKQLEEMKMQESQAMQVEMDSTAQQVESLSGSALTMSERDIENALNDIPVYKDKPHYLHSDEVFKNGQEIEHINEDDEWSGVNSRYVCFDLHAKSHVFVAANAQLYHAGFGQIRAALTPAQKQQKIDEHNGKSYYKIICKVERDNEVCGLNNPWNELKDKWQKIYIDIAKQIDFKGKLESI